MTRKPHLICPNCGAIGAGPEWWQGDIDVLRDIKATRVCNRCKYRWLPADDPPDAGGPYIEARER